MMPEILLSLLMPKTKMLRSLFMLCSLILMLGACAGPVQKPPMAVKNKDKRLAGRVYQVVEDAQFVLIRKYGKWVVLDGETVQSQREGRSANLLPTGEQLGEHVAADIRSGSVRVGDAVYIRKSHTN